MIEKVKIESQLLHFLLKDNSVFEKIIGDVGVKSNDFENQNHKDIIDFCSQYFAKHQKVPVKKELQEFTDDMLKNNEIEDMAQFGLLNAWDIAEDWCLEDGQYDRILDNFMRDVRKARIENIISGGVNRKIYDEGRFEEYAQKVSTELDDIARPTFDSAAKFSWMDAQADADLQFSDAKQRRENPEKYVGIPTGIKALDEGKFTGFEDGTLTLVGAIINTGKSTFALNVAKNIYNMGKNVVVVSLEMGEEQWMRKFNSLDFSIPYNALQRGQDPMAMREDGGLRLNGEGKTIPEYNALEKYEKGLTDRKQSNIQNYHKVVSAPAGVFSWKEIVEEIEKQTATKPPDIIFIDYIALIKLPGVNLKRDELGQLTISIRSYAKIKNIPIVLIVQANRSSIIRRGAKRDIDINIENVEDSNQPGAHADCFLALMAQTPATMLLKIVKQREGPKDTFELRARLDYCYIGDKTMVGDFNQYDSKIDLGDDIEDTGLDEINFDKIDASSLDSLSPTESDEDVSRELRAMYGKTEEIVSDKESVSEPDKKSVNNINKPKTQEMKKALEM